MKFGMIMGIILATYRPI